MDPKSLPARWSEGDARRVLEVLEASGCSMAEFARRHGLKVKRLQRWRARLRGRTPPNRFVEVVAHQGAVDSVEVLCPTGHVVRVPDGVAPGTLFDVLDVLEQFRC